MLSASARAQPLPSVADLTTLGLRDSNAPTLLFGSHARGDGRPGSDIDVLQLARSPASYADGSLSVTVYRADDLRSMAARGSLFVLHLRTDGHLLTDMDHTLETILNAWQPPASYDRLREAVREASGALDISEADFRRNATGYFNLATFLSRTEIYARCASQGRPEFSVSLAAARCGASNMGRLLDDRRDAPRSWSRFVELRRLMADDLNIPCANARGSLEALVVHLDATTPIGAALVLRTFAGDPDINYHLMPSDTVPW